MLRVAEVVSTFDTDLVGLGEYEYSQAGQLHRRLTEAYPYRAIYPYATDVALFSRYPILEKRLIRSPELRSPLLRAVVDIQGVAVTVYVVHLISPTLFGLPWQYEDAARNQESALVRDLLARESGPLLVLCDCNFTDQSDAYQSFDTLLTDAFREAGCGMGFTYPNEQRFLPPLVRIDYIWHNDHFSTLEAYPLNDSGTSDHRPIVARLAITQ